MKNRNLVYSTDQGRLCPDCEQPAPECQCKNVKSVGDGKVLIGLETKGRKSKGVTIIKGLPITEDKLKTLAKKLKAQCGSGGSVKNGHIEIQGDNRQKIKDLLEKEGYKSKFTGG